MSKKRPLPIIPDHEVIRKIGSGAYGEVWLARTIMGAWRAVKIVRRADFDDDITFQREFEGIRHYEPIARNHPGLVHILHVGTGKIPSPFYYYVMELGDDVTTGTDINQETYIPRTLQTDKKVAAGKPLPVDYTLQIGLQLSDALAYLHSKGLTHRDIKPANIIFVDNRPKLADVGLVAQLNQRTFVGTEGFIPHEGPGSPRADVYALGKVLYEITTGRDRLDFPELPDSLPENINKQQWLSLNNVICAVCEPQVEKCTLSEAKQLYASLKRIKQGQVIAAAHQKSFLYPLKWILSLLAVIVTFSIVTLLLLYTSEPQTPPAPPAPPAIAEQGQLIINTQPSGAAIYNEKGEYIDETPYGPITLPVGTEVMFTLKKEGYKPWKEKGIIRSDKTLGIGGTMIPFTPPTKGKTWTDAQSNHYNSENENHISTTPVTYESAQNFFSEIKKRTAKLSSFTEQSYDNNGSTSYALLTPDQALEYSEWLSQESARKGLLNDEQSITPRKINQWKKWSLSPENKAAHLSAYKMVASNTHFVHAKINTQPEGALIIFNGITIGTTPLVCDNLTPGHFSLILKLPGYAKKEISGSIQPKKEFIINETLAKDNSVIFGKNWNNSLGMSFVPITPYLSASQHETTSAHYLAYVAEQGLEHPLTPSFSQKPTHPAVGMTREQARQFADWLTRKEHKEGILEFSDFYRLPTDQEWTILAGGITEQGKYPSERHTSTFTPELNAASASDIFPWGNTWPPSQGYANFSDNAAKQELNGRTIEHYHDGFSYTAPTGSFMPNKLGLYDISGNVWEWVDDNYGGTIDFKFKDYEVARGGSWATYKPHQLLTRFRVFLPPNTKEPDVGFRLVLVREVPLPATHAAINNETAIHPFSSLETNVDNIPLNQEIPRDSSPQNIPLPNLSPQTPQAPQEQIKPPTKKVLPQKDISLPHLSPQIPPITTPITPPQSSISSSPTRTPS